nr:hypothetical protein Iba_chr15cCG5820 [Ipomoea batatas]
MVAADMLVSNKLGEWEELNVMVPDLYDGEVSPDFSLQLGQVTVSDDTILPSGLFGIFPHAFDTGKSCSILFGIFSAICIWTVKYNMSSSSKTDETENNNERAWMNLAFPLSSAKARNTHVIWLNWGCCWGADPRENRRRKVEGGNLGADPQTSTRPPSGYPGGWWGLQDDPSHEFPISEGPFLQVLGIQKKMMTRVYGALILLLLAPLFGDLWEYLSELE